MVATKTKTYRVKFCHAPVGATFIFYHDGGRLNDKHGECTKIDEWCFKCTEGVIWQIGDRLWDIEVISL